LNTTEKEIIKELFRTDMRNGHKDQGLFIRFKDNIIKKKKGKLKKYCIIAYGNSMTELSKNFERVNNEIPLIIKELPIVEIEMEK
jgi:hypothetical protein